MTVDFDAAASTWDDDPRRLAHSVAIAASIAQALPLNPATNALDYGCGTGQLTWQLASVLGHVTLADSSPGMIEVVRQRIETFPDAELGRFDAVVMDLSRERAEPASVDLIYSALALHHVHDIASVLGQFKAALRPGGHVAIADLDHDADGEFHGAAFDGHHGFDREALARALRSAGFASPDFSTATTVMKMVGDRAKPFTVFLAVSALA